MQRHDYWNAWPTKIRGAEGDGDQGGDDSSDSGDDDSDDTDDEGNDDSGNTEPQPTAEDIARLQQALAKERRDNKRLTRENNRLTATKQQETTEEMTEVQRAKAAEQTAQAKADRLAAGLLRRDIDSAIRAEAEKLKFLDPTDAIDGVDRSSIIYDQDDEDPTDIAIELATVQAAVKALATRKPHFISRGTTDGDPTGSSMGGSKGSKRSSEDALRAAYPSL